MLKYLVLLLAFISTCRKVEGIFFKCKSKKSNSPPKQPLIIPQVSLPLDDELYDLLKKSLVPSPVDLLPFTLKLEKILMKLIGKPKDSAGLKVLDDARKLYVDKIVNHKELLPGGFEYFGVESNIENLRLFLLNNPFYSAAISSKGGIFWNTFEVNSNDKTTWFGKFMDTFEDSYPFVNAEFNSNFEITKITAYNKTTNAEISKSNEEAAGDLLFLLNAFANIIHSTIHVFHLILSSSIASSVSPVDNSVHPWAAPYYPNVYDKYHAGELALFGGIGAWVGGLYRTDKEKVFNAVREVLIVWLQVETADEFVDKFLLSSLKKTNSIKAFKNAGGLEEFFKHQSLIHPYAQEITKIFEASNAKELKKTNNKISSYLSQVIENTPSTSIKSLSSVIELSAVTGIIHGSTLSGTRLMLTNEMAKRLTKSDVFGTKDVLSATLATLSLIGLVEDRHVFSSSIQKIDEQWVKYYKSKSNSEILSPLLKDVLIKYDAKSTAIQSEYLKEITKNQKDFIKNGWILTDYAPDGIDGKQLTFVGYI